MKIEKLILGAMVILMTMTSCFDDKDPYSAGIYFYRPCYLDNGVYANTTVDSVVMFSYGKWNVSLSDGSWTRLGLTEGKGNVIYRIPVSFDQNTTGKSRQCMVRFYDVEHPDVANIFYYIQHATRGDGSLGNAPAVKKITGSDGSLFEFSYDNIFRPVNLTMSKNGTSLRSLALIYNDRDSSLVVYDGDEKYMCTYSPDYQPYSLKSSTDTIGYYNMVLNNYYPPIKIIAFSYEHHKGGKVASAATYYLNGRSLAADSMHVADSVYQYANGEIIEKVMPKYSNVDNRCQTVDVNQLVDGIDHCDPYLLMSLFRYARHTSVLSELTSGKRHQTVEVQLNADKSISRMTVSTTGGDTIVYDFEY
ncbi:hypothetical protein L6472_09405 [Prevotella sp. E13-17]|uniref:hypothetical protein n=1 Tax=Prevotella sp. E13-17 TaxID=2913616 RepID=UPI001EDBF7FF|nr:hypothetical protein [Prevotella sp. E13-17]UKK50240.1 hypothetical protein L6472_09405 [Prevotella sp. E13-17]